MITKQKWNSMVVNVCVRPVFFHVFSLLLSYVLLLSGEDVWSYAKKLPHLFQQGGVFYNIVKKDMGNLSLFHFLTHNLNWVFKILNCAWHHGMTTSLLCVLPKAFAVTPYCEGGIWELVKSRPSEKLQFAFNFFIYFL